VIWRELDVKSLTVDLNFALMNPIRCQLEMLVFCNE